MSPSLVQPRDVDALEADLRVRLPPFYRAFLCCRVVLGLDFGDYALPDVGCDDPLVEVRTLLSASLGPGFIQFGHARGCGDPLCFDLTRADEDGDCPVVVFNHDVVPAEAWRVRAELLRYAAVVAPSFRGFLTSLLTDDAAIFPPPESPEELRRNAAWSRVEGLLREKGLTARYRPPGVDPSDPWAIADAIERAR